MTESWSGWFEKDANFCFKLKYFSITFWCKFKLTNLIGLKWFVLVEDEDEDEYEYEYDSFDFSSTNFKNCLISEGSASIVSLSQRNKVKQKWKKKKHNWS